MVNDWERRPTVKQLLQLPSVQNALKSRARELYIGNLVRSFSFQITFVLLNQICWLASDETNLIITLDTLWNNSTGLLIVTFLLFLPKDRKTSNKNCLLKKSVLKRPTVFGNYIYIFSRFEASSLSSCRSTWCLSRFACWSRNHSFPPQHIFGNWSDCLRPTQLRFTSYENRTRKTNLRI